MPHASEAAASRDRIVREIRRLAKESGGQAPGKRRFYLATGIKETDWSGRFWTRWGDAVTEAGFSPNRLQEVAFSEDQLLQKLAEVTSALGRFPTIAELKLYSRTHEDFPSHNVFGRIAKTRAERAARLLQFCEARAELRAVSEICAAIASSVRADREVDEVEQPRGGYVYLLRSGRFYKVGFTNSAGRRTHELAIQLPQPSKLVHSIETDDPPGIEQDWHPRFAGRRRNGEWFELSGEDIAAFRKRRFM